MRQALILLALALPTFGQNVIPWSATTGNVTVSSSAYAATIQQPASGAVDQIIDKITVYCSASCVATMSANGAAATATAGTVQALLPSQTNQPVPLTFWTASNVGAGTAQGGANNINDGASASTFPLCLSTLCGNGFDTVISKGLGTSGNYTVNIASFSGTVNITFYGRSMQ